MNSCSILSLPKDALGLCLESLVIDWRSWNSLRRVCKGFKEVLEKKEMKLKLAQHYLSERQRPLIERD